MRTPSQIPSLLGLTVMIGTACGFAAADPLPSPAELLKEYRALGLPLPPESAKLVIYEGFGGGIVNGKVVPPRRGLAFEVRPGTKTEKPVLLRGTLEWRPDWDPRTQKVKPDVAAVRTST